MSNQQQNNLKAKNYYDKGLFALEKENYDYALDLFAQACSTQRTYDDAHYMLWLTATKKFQRQPPSKFQTVINKIKGWLPTLKGNFNLSKGKHRQALVEYEKVLLNEPENVSMLHKVAQLLLTENMRQAAVKMFVEITKLDPQNVAVIKSLGKIYLQEGNYLKARSFYQSALKISPGDTEAQRELKNLEALGTIEESFPGPEGRPTS